MQSEPETPKDSILKPKAKKAPVQQTEEARAALALRMRELNDKKILAASEKIRREQEAKKASAPDPGPAPVVAAAATAEPAPVAKPEPPKIIRQKKFIKVIEITDDEESDDEPPIIIKKKAKQPKALEEVPAPPVRKPRVVRPPKEPVYEMPRGRFL